MALADGKGTRQGRKEGGCREGGEPGGQGEGEERKGQAEERPAAKLGVYVERRRQGIRSSGDVTALSSVIWSQNLLVCTQGSRRSPRCRPCWYHLSLPSTLTPSCGLKVAENQDKRNSRGNCCVVRRIFPWPPPAIFADARGVKGTRWCTDIPEPDRLFDT